MRPRCQHVFTARKSHLEHGNRQSTLRGILVNFQSRHCPENGSLHDGVRPSHKPELNKRTSEAGCQYLSRDTSRLFEPSKSFPDLSNSQRWISMKVFETAYKGCKRFASLHSNCCMHVSLMRCLHFCRTCHVPSVFIYLTTPCHCDAITSTVEHALKRVETSAHSAARYGFAVLL